MQTQDSQLKQIQAGNEEVRKKLQVFRSGLQRLMSKKSSKKSQRHEPPSHDNKKPLTNQQFSTQQKKYNPPNESPQNQKLQQQQFGFNSTLFRQIHDQTVLSNNSSGVNNFYGLHNQNNQDNYASVGSVNSQKTGEYFSTSTKKSDYDYQTFSAFNNNDKIAQSKESQSFKKSSLLFSEIDQLMNKVSKSSKLPIKPIQKYINQQESKIISDSRQIDLTLSNSSVLPSDQKRGKYQFQQLIKNQNTFQNKSSKNFKKEQIKNEKGSLRQLKSDRGSIKESLRETSSFLKNVKERSSSMQGMKQPPLPPSQLSIRTIHKGKQLINNEGQDFLEWGKKISQRRSLSKGIEQGNLELGKGQRQRQQMRERQIRQMRERQRQQIRGQYSISEKIKSTINERKKLIKQEGLMDDSIELELSSQQQVGDVADKQDKNRIRMQIKRLQQQKGLLLDQLQGIQNQLQQLQSQL